MEEKNLIKGLIKKDEKHLRAFVECHQDLVYKTCLAYVQNEEDAADLTQEVFIKALDSVSKFRFQSSISTWLVRIAINHSLNHKRSTLKVVNGESINLLTNTQDDISSSIEYKMNNEELGLALKVAIQRLPENQSKVFVLKRYHDYSYKEISEITGLSEAAIDSLLSRAKQNLQTSLLNFYKDNYQ